MSMSKYVNWKSGKVRSFVSFSPSQRICPLRGSVTRPTTKRDVGEAKRILLPGLCTLKFPAITYILYTCPNFPILQQFLYHSVGFRFYSARWIGRCIFEVNRWVQRWKKCKKKAQRNHNGSLIAMELFAIFFYKTTRLLLLTKRPINSKVVKRGFLLRFAS